MEVKIKITFTTDLSINIMKPTYLNKVIFTSNPGLQSSNRDKKSNINGKTTFRMVIASDGAKRNNVSPPSITSLAFWLFC